MRRPPRATVRSSRRHPCWHSVRRSPSENIRKAGLAEPDGLRLGVHHGSMPGWATGQPLPLLGEDDAESQEEGRLVQFREDWCD
jgi:hypothetical protein